jgi:DNA-binding winged helix-turn-helix (wHTH) protein
MSKTLDAGFFVGDFEVRPRQGVMIKSNETIRLEPKVMAILVCLAERQGEVVSRADFAELVWRGRLVSDEVLSRNISVLRSQLGDNARDPDFIETIPTAGYRFLASVRPLEVEGTSSDSRRPWYLAGAGFILAATLAALFWLTTTSEPTPLPTSTVAVLPFQDLSDAAGSDYFSEGLTDELLVALGRAEGLRVVARTSSYAFKDRDVDVRVIGTTLGAGSRRRSMLRSKRYLRSRTTYPRRSPTSLRQRLCRPCARPTISKPTERFCAPTISCDGAGWYPFSAALSCSAKPSTWIPSLGAPTWDLPALTRFDRDTRAKTRIRRSRWR